jgi:hypothetical protein
MKRQKLILFVLVIVLVLALLYAYWSSPQQQTVSVDDVARSFARNNVARNDASTVVDPQQVHLDLLKIDKEKYKGYKRNIFNYYRPKPKPIPKPKVVVKTPPQPKPKPKPANPVTTQVRQQLARFTFLGLLEKDGVKTVFLSKKDALYLVKKDDSFGGNNQFKVLDISDENMAISQSDADGLIDIRLVEEEPLIPSFSPGEVSTESFNGSGVRQPAGKPAPQKGVPSTERRRQWYKDVQPE